MATANVSAPTSYAEAEAAWNKERLTFIGGSEDYHLFNIPQYGKGCARYLGFKKLGREIESEFSPEDEALLRRGHLMEPLVAELYEEKTGRKVRRPPTDNYGFGKPRRHPDYPFLGVHTDRTILAGVGGVTETGDLEIKSHGEGPFLRIMREGLPAGHHLQIQHSMLVNRRTWGGLAMIGVFGGLPLEHADIQADPKLQDDIKRAGYTFWNELQKGNLPPQLPDADDMRCQVCPFRKECRGQEVDAALVSFMEKQKASDKKLVEIKDMELAQDIKALEILKAEAKVLDSDNEAKPGAIQLLNDKILRRFAELGYTSDYKPFIPGVLSVSIIPAQFNGLDQKRLKAEKPDVYNDYYVRNKYTGNNYIVLYKIRS